jgi:hypothetical protein
MSQGIVSTHPASYWRFMGGKNAAQFRMQHHLRHATYDAALAKAGISLATYDLTAEVNQSWLALHDSRHKTLTTIIQKNLANMPNQAPPAPPSPYRSGTADLSSLDFANEQAVTAWMQFHASLHQQLDAYFGIAARG